MNSNQNYNKIFSSKKNQEREYTKTKQKNPWKNERKQTRENKRGLNVT